MLVPTAGGHRVTVVVVGRFTAELEGAPLELAVTLAPGSGHDLRVTHAASGYSMARVTELDGDAVVAGRLAFAELLQRVGPARVASAIRRVS